MDQILIKKVVICQHRLLHYRLGLFERLRNICIQRDIELHLVHGQASRRELVKRDEGSLPWAYKVRNRFWEMAGIDIVWQPFPPDLRDADLVVVMQESRILSNYPLLFGRYWNKRKVAYWGHGRNFQSDNPECLREKWKSKLTGSVDWWFAYTDMTRGILLADGYPAERITVLDNAIDNESFQRDLEAITTDQLDGLRAEISADVDAPIGLYCGSLYPDKRLDYLIAAADRIQQAIPEFRLVVIGDGPSAREIETAAANHPWLHWVGVRKGQEKAAYFRLASIVLNPGLVGLHVLDSFCAGVPMMTTPDAKHSPEIAYLKDGVNGLVVAGSPENYATSVINLLNDRDNLERIKQAALQDAQRYTLDNMVNRFADGIEHCLASPKKRGGHSVNFTTRNNLESGGLHENR